MCACEFGYVCPRCSGTPHDPRYFLEPDPAELQQEHAAALISQPDFLRPSWEPRG